MFGLPDNKTGNWYQDTGADLVRIFVYGALTIAVLILVVAGLIIALVVK
jgi:hypothetical protein